MSDTIPTSEANMDNKHRMHNAGLVIAKTFSLPRNKPINATGQYLSASELGLSPEENTVVDWVKDPQGSIVNYEERGTLPQWLGELAGFSSEPWTSDDLNSLGKIIIALIDNPIIGEVNA